MASKKARDLTYETSFNGNEIYLIDRSDYSTTKKMLLSDIEDYITDNLTRYHNLSTKITDYTLTLTDDIIIFDNLSTGTTLTLPSASSDYTGLIFNIKNNDDTWDVELSGTTLTLSPGEYRSFTCDGINWILF